MTLVSNSTHKQPYVSKEAAKLLMTSLGIKPERAKKHLGAFAENLNLAIWTYEQETRNYTPLSPTLGIKTSQSVRLHATGILKAVGLTENDKIPHFSFLKKNVSNLHYDYKRILSAGEMDGGGMQLALALQRLVAFCEEAEKEYTNKKKAANSHKQEDRAITHFLRVIFQLYADLHDGGLPAINSWPGVENPLIGFTIQIGEYSLNAMGERVASIHRKKLKAALSPKAIESRINREPDFLKKSIQV